MDFYNMAKSLKDEYLSDLKELIAIKSIKDTHSISDNAPFGKGCKQAIDFMISLAKRDGFKFTNYDGYALAIEYGSGDELIGVLAHLDVVPAKDWLDDPFSLKLIDSYVVGRGIIDDKGPALAAYYSMKILKKYGIKLNKRVILILGVDEENDMACIDYYKSHGEIPKYGFSPDADFPLIYGEKGIATIKLSIKNDYIKFIDAGERYNVVIGDAQFTLKDNTVIDKIETNDSVSINGDYINVKGVSAHACYPWKGKNAGVKALFIIANLYSDTSLLKLAEMLLDWTGEKMDLNVEGEHLKELTQSLGVIELKDNVLNLYINIRYPENITSQQILAKFKKLELDNVIDVEVLQDSKPKLVDPNSKFVKVLLEAYGKYSNNKHSKAYTIGGGTYARKFDNFVGFGPVFTNAKDERIGGIHQVNEGMKFDDLLKCIAIYADGILKLVNEV